jgi:ketosteroid isomerase-like protein
MISESNRRLLVEHFAAMERGDFDAVADSITDDFVQEWPQSGERVRGKEACMNIFRNYPGGGPSARVRRVSGEGDLIVAEVDMEYDGKPTHMVAIIELHGGKISRETDYWADPFPAPEWRAQWVERIDAVPA